MPAGEQLASSWPEAPPTGGQPLPSELDHLLAIDNKHGRVRDIPNGPRTLDLDIVLYGGSRVDEPGLHIPHPRAHERQFVIAPLLEVWPDAVIPGRGPARDFAR